MVINLVKRNLKLFLRSKSTVFFSFLGSIILIVLHFAFFGKMNADNYIQYFPGVDYKYMRWLSDSMMFGAIIPMTSVTLSLSLLSQMVNDRENKTIDDFLVMPTKRSYLMLSYILTSVTVCIVVAFLMVVFFDIYLFATAGILFSFKQIILLVLTTLLGVLFGNLFMLSIIVLVKNERAVGAVGSVVGTMYGFLAGAYIPIAVFGKSMRYVFNCMPFLSSVALVKHVFVMDAATVIGVPSTAIMEVEKFAGSVIHFGNEPLSSWVLVGVVLSYCAVFFIAVLYKFKVMKNK